MLPIGINERVFMTSIDKTINDAFKPIASGFNDLVFYSVPIGESQLPLIVLWLIAGALYFTFYLRLINIRGFTHAIRIVLGKEDKIQNVSWEKYVQDNIGLPTLNDIKNNLQKLIKSLE